jgi:hypothetical protein
MSKNRKFAEGEVPEPTFDKQMEVYSEEESNTDDPIFSSAYHKFMANLLKKRDAAVKDELIETLSEVLKPWYEKLEQIINGQIVIQADITALKDMADENRVRIEHLEASFDLHNKILSGHNTILRNLQKTVKKLTNEHNHNH